jgi:hypothetical protein
LDITTVLVSSGLGLVTGAAATAATLQMLIPRVTRLEDFRNDMPKDYVPRNEHALALANINATTGRIEALLQSYILHGSGLAIHAIEASAANFAPDDDPDTIEAYIAGACPRFEGVVPHFYLDTKGLVTIGTGNMVPDLDTALQLRLISPSGQPATHDQIFADFQRVRQMERGHVASFYHSLSSPLLPTAANHDLLRSRCTEFYAQLRSFFPGFDQFPAAARLCMLDMIYNLGQGRVPAPGRPGSGLLNYTHMCEAVDHGDFAGAAGMCARNVHDPAFCLRNSWTSAQFLLAAKEVSPKT